MDIPQDILCVDSREPAQIFKKLDRRKVRYNKVFLPVGDFIYNDIVIERKQIMDFYNSLQNRLWEQVRQMQENFTNVVIIVVGSVKECYSRLDNFNENMIHGAIASLIIKHKVQVIRVETETQLIMQVLKICEKSHEPIKHAINRKQATHEDILLNMLACIDKIGYKKAKLILAKYKSIPELVLADEQELQQIKGIGVELARNIKKIFGKLGDKHAV